MKKLLKSYQGTMYACFLGYIVQAIVNNFAPLLFLTFQTSYEISLSKITLLVTFNFLTQLALDAASVLFIDKIGYRAAAILAHVFSALGLAALAILPELFADPYVGLVIAVMIYAPGGGLLEVLISPIVEACPTDNKEKAMSMLHSFYCWGHMGVVLISTLFFFIFGIKNWKIMAYLWALVPLFNVFVFSKVPIKTTVPEGTHGMSLKSLLKNKLFWIMLVAMICSGASEHSVSQWASVFAEKGLGISKTLGDLMGPMFFALMMGISRAIYGKYGEKIPLEKFMKLSCMMCVASFLIISLSPIPLIALLGCGLAGFSVGIFWPGCFSISSASLPAGGTVMFCLLALCGDLGCSLGPTVVGMVSSAFNDRLQAGILVAVLFPAMLIACVMMRRKLAKKG